MTCWNPWTQPGPKWVNILQWIVRLDADRFMVRYTGAIIPTGSNHIYKSQLAKEQPKGFQGSTLRNTEIYSIIWRLLVLLFKLNTYLYSAPISLCSAYWVVKRMNRSCSRHKVYTFGLLSDLKSRQSKYQLLLSCWCALNFSSWIFPTCRLLGHRI